MFCGENLDENTKQQCVTLLFFHSYKTQSKSNESMRLYNLPDRRIFDRRFKTIPVKEMISNMGKRFVSEGFADSSTTIVAVDSSLIHAKNKRVWHKSTMKNNMMVPRSGIDVDARWGFSRNKGWIFGYKLHLSCSTSKLIVPLSVDFTTANISDNQMYRNLIESLPNETQYVCYI